MRRLLLIATPLAIAGDSLYKCTPVNQSAIDPFCSQVLPLLPRKTCVDATGYRKRSATGYKKQRDECSSAKKRESMCPNEPFKCSSQIFSYKEYCGVYDQRCESDSDCVGFCFGDCFPCNDRGDCEILQSFGVIAPDGSPCFSPHNHSLINEAAPADVYPYSSSSITTTTTTTTTSSFPLFWNVDEATEPRVDVTRYGYAPRNATQVGNQCAADPPPHANAGCRPWTQGKFPTIDSDGHWINGGVPQNAHLEAHLAEIRATLPVWIPNASFDGNAVLDFEAWTTVWELNNHTGDWHSERYRNASRWLVSQAHPTWSAGAVEAAAKEAFQRAATQWFVETLNTCRALRPQARWGFYGLPQAATGDCVGSGAAMRCGFDGPHAALLRLQAEAAQLPIWQASDAIYPSIYIPHSMKGRHDVVQAYIRSTVGEAVRCARLARIADRNNGLGFTRPVVPFGWDHFHAPPWPARRLPVSYVIAQLQGSADAGAAGVIFWGSAAAASNASYWGWFESEVGPQVRAWCERREGGC